MRVTIHRAGLPRWLIFWLRLKRELAFLRHFPRRRQRLVARAFHHELQADLEKEFIYGRGTRL